MSQLRFALKVRCHCVLMRSLLAARDTRVQISRSGLSPDNEDWKMQASPLTVQTRWITFAFAFQFIERDSKCLSLLIMSVMIHKFPLFSTSILFFLLGGGGSICFLFLFLLLYQAIYAHFLDNHQFDTLSVDCSYNLNLVIFEMC